MKGINDEEQIRTLIETWAKAVREKDIETILSHHSDDFVMYDVPPPFRSTGLHSYCQTWDTFFNWAKESGILDIKKLHIVAGTDVAFCFANMQCAVSSKNNEKELLDFRLTIGLKKINEQWIILHEHHSIPAL